MYVNYKLVGQRIAQRRKELGYKQYEVTEMAGLSDKYLSNIERATSVLSVDVLMRLCTVLETTPDALLLGARQESSDDFTRYIARKAPELTPAQRKLVLQFIEMLCQNEDLFKK